MSFSRTVDLGVNALLYLIASPVFIGIGMLYVIGWIVLTLYPPSREWVDE